MKQKLTISPEDNRNKLILIGNGFDLAHGLETKYSDFLLWYLQNIITVLNSPESKEPNIPKCKYEDEIIRITKKYNSSEPPLTLDSIEEFMALKLNNQIHIKPKNPINPLNGESFLEYLIKLGGEKRWVDIEYEYFSRLVTIYNTHHLTQGLVHSLVKKLNKDFTFIQKKLQEYISTEVIQKNIDRQPQITNIITQINNSAQSETLYFLNFNYTKTINDYIYGENNIFDTVFSSKNKNQITVSNIHGSVFDNKYPIIFGYGDDMTDYFKKFVDENDNELTVNFKTFHYLKSDNYKKLSTFIHSETYDVYILGHSCGVSDRTLLNMIFENPNCNSIQIYHYQKKDGSTDSFEKTQEISRCISQSNYKINFMDKVVPYNENDWMSKEE